jgi:hypothetical protein
MYPGLIAHSDLAFDFGGKRRDRKAFGGTITDLGGSQVGWLEPHREPGSRKRSVGYINMSGEVEWWLQTRTVGLSDVVFPSGELIGAVSSQALRIDATVLKFKHQRGRLSIAGPAGEIANFPRVSRGWRVHFSSARERLRYLAASVPYLWELSERNYA